MNPDERTFRELLVTLEELVSDLAMAPTPERRTQYVEVRRDLLALFDEVYRDTERLDLVEAQSNGAFWCARQSQLGRGFRLHNTNDLSKGAHTTAREAIDALEASHGTRTTP